MSWSSAPTKLSVDQKRVRSFSTRVIERLELLGRGRHGDGCCGFDGSEALLVMLLAHKGWVSEGASRSFCLGL